ncbi:Mediator of RNA polymerase II transcription subunit 15 [Brachionus plicatilis]|uniref:Mediator of RNA polymerase II transcription subunit 15 n=1 Tax=Brachionus plicatilis TaxID=10195 RepID=A0A3M7QDP8_BRAPC|nr:Mediator of RNA polymerase II transcription subunit 15 [Brachionus plicatilis]
MTYFSKSQPAPSDFDRLFICFFWSINNEKKNFNLLAHDEIKESAKKTTSSKSEYTKLLNEKNSDYVKSINFTKDNLITVCFKDQQLFDLVRFGSFEKYYSVFNFDTTYNLGDFYVSYFTYRNLSLNINGTDQHPIFMGPLMDFEIDDIDNEKILYLILGSTSEREKSLIASNSKIEYIEKLDLISKYFETIGSWNIKPERFMIFLYYTTNDKEGYNN